MKDVYITDRLLPLMEAEGIKDDKDLYKKIINIKEDHPYYDEVKDILSEIKALKKGVWKHSAIREDYKAEISDKYESKNIDTKFLILYKYYFGCTFEYLLGYSEEPFPEAQTISEATGIDKDNVKKLIRMKRQGTAQNITALNKIIKYNDFRSDESYLSFICYYLDSGSNCYVGIKRSADEEYHTYTDRSFHLFNSGIYSWDHVINKKGIVIEANSLKEVFLMKANSVLEDIRKKALTRKVADIPPEVDLYAFDPIFLFDNVVDIEEPMNIETKIAIKELTDLKNGLKESPYNYNSEIRYINQHIKAAKKTLESQSFYSEAVLDQGQPFEIKSKERGKKNGTNNKKR